MPQIYSRFYMLNRTDLFKSMTATFKQVILEEGDKTDTNLYMVYEGQVLLKKRIQLETGRYKTVPFAVLQAGQTFNEQGIVNTHFNLQLAE